jgi:broad specificity phosphatase PhoE
MPLIYLLRHGQTSFNAEGRIQGVIDVPLNARGRAQAKRNGGVLSELISDKPRFDFVASPLLRARETMEIVRTSMGFAADGYRTDDRLQEVRFGAWGGMTMDEIAMRDPENYRRRQADIWNVAPPEGESIRELYERATDWLAGVTADTIVVAHGGTIRCLRGHLLKLAPEELIYLDVPQDKVLMIEGDKLTWL